MLVPVEENEIISVLEKFKIESKPINYSMNTKMQIFSKNALKDVIVQNCIAHTLFSGSSVAFAQIPDLMIELTKKNLRSCFVHVNAIYSGKNYHVYQVSGLKEVARDDFVDLHNKTGLHPVFMKSMDCYNESKNYNYAESVFAVLRPNHSLVIPETQNKAYDALLNYIYEFNRPALISISAYLTQNIIENCSFFKKCLTFCDSIFFNGYYDENGKFTSISSGILINP